MDSLTYLCGVKNSISENEWILKKTARKRLKKIEMNIGLIDVDGTTYKLNIDYPPIGQVAIRYNTEDDDLDSLFGLMGDDLFELIVLMGEQLTANGYKLNGIEKGGDNE